MSFRDLLQRGGVLVACADAPALAHRVTEHVDTEADWFCQAQGAAVAYFQVRAVSHRPLRETSLGNCQRHKTPAA